MIGQLYQTSLSAVNSLSHLLLISCSWSQKPQLHHEDKYLWIYSIQQRIKIEIYERHNNKIVASLKS